MTRSSTELRSEVEEARTRLASTVGEIGGVIDETRAELVDKAKRYAPYAAGVVGTYVIFKIFRKARR